MFRARSEFVCSLQDGSRGRQASFLVMCLDEIGFSLDWLLQDADLAAFFRLAAEA